jgi:hypothetical protein
MARAVVSREKGTGKTRAKEADEEVATVSNDRENKRLRENRPKRSTDNQKIEWLLSRQYLWTEDKTEHVDEETILLGWRLDGLISKKTHWFDVNIARVLKNAESRTGLKVAKVGAEQAEHSPEGSSDGKEKG